MGQRLWVLGSADPEMEAIEGLLRASGERFAYAVTAAGERVRGGDAYRAAAVRRADDDADGVRQPETWYLVECSVQAPDGVRSVVIDHHRPGDPGYGRPPSEFLAASSIGQVLGVLARHRRITESAAKRGGWEPVRRGPRPELGSGWCDGALAIGGEWEHGTGEYTAIGRWIGWFAPPAEIAHVAAADHCLGAAYRGECPGVDPDELMHWRVASRAQFQRRSPEEVLADVERAREVLSYAAYGGLCRVCGGSGRDDEWQCTSCCGRGWEPAHAVSLRDGVRAADLRGVHVPELVEAATRDDVAYIVDGLPDRDGRRKVVCSGPADVVRAFLETWAPSQGLVDLYGDPMRGFAGGYMT